jgi:thioredoxin 1
MAPPGHFGCHGRMTPTRMSALFLAPALAAVLALTGCSSSGSTVQPPPVSASMSDEPMASDEPVAAAPGTYITLADYRGNEAMYANGDVVLFFHADWCPTCQATEEDLTANAAAIPPGLTIVKVDYDDSDDLKRQYGVTTQHTYVQVDPDGNELAKWTGSMTSADIAAAAA